MIRIGVILSTIILGSSIMTFFNKSDTGPEEKVREPGVAGAFYPGDSKTLSETVRSLLAQAKPPAIAGTLVGIISPHAGYVYSGHVAAYGYDLLRDRQIERVIVISPSHIIGFSGSAVYDGTAYRTPLGKVDVDTEFCRQLAAGGGSITLSSEGHETRRQGRMEHALEVQLPFLQEALGAFKLVPVVMGDQDYETCRQLGNALAEMIKDDKTIIVASSDLSHFHSYEEAVRMDKKVIAAVEEWDHLNLSRNLSRRVWEACGGGPIVTLMIAAEDLGADRVKILKYANSGDVPVGEKSSVVGYMSAVFFKSGVSAAEKGFNFSLSKEEQKYLLEIARKSVEEAVINGRVYESSAGKFESLQKDRGAFVTINEEGRLRGCIGYTSAVQPLHETVRSCAISAAMKDPRFPAVNKNELPRLHYEISVLSPFHLIKDIGEIRVGKHGLLVKKGMYEGLLLPQVATDNRWDELTFIRQTCRKAGLPENAWEDAETDIFVFSAFVFGEE